MDLFADIDVQPVLVAFLRELLAQARTAQQHLPRGILHVFSRFRSCFSPTLRAKDRTCRSKHSWYPIFRTLSSVGERSSIPYGFHSPSGTLVEIAYLR